MKKNKGVSSKTHNKQQLNDYANQNNPNNRAYKARKENQANQVKCKLSKKRHMTDNVANLEWFCYGWYND